MAVDLETENTAAGSFNGKCLTFPKLNDVLTKMQLHDVGLLTAVLSSMMSSLEYAGKEALPARFGDSTLFDVFYEPEAKMFKLYVAKEGEFNIPKYISVDGKDFFLKFEENSFLPAVFTSESELQIECSQVIPFKKPEKIDDPESIKNKIMNNPEVPEQIKEKIRNMEFSSWEDLKKKLPFNFDGDLPF